MVMFPVPQTTLYYTSPIIIRKCLTNCLSDINKHCFGVTLVITSNVIGNKTY